MNKNMKLLLLAVFSLSLASFLSSLSWICALLEHLKVLYFIFAFIACGYFVFKKNIRYVILCCVCVALNFSPAFLVGEAIFFHSEVVNTTLILQ